jgi:hypothetical protein
VLVELGLVGLRYQAVLEVVNQGATVTDVAVRFGVTRQTVHRWLRRYAAKVWLGWQTGRRSRCRAASDGGGGRGANRQLRAVEPGVGSADDLVLVGG